MRFQDDRLTSEFKRWAVAISICAVSSVAQSAWGIDEQHALFTAELKKYVDANGVHYKRWKEDETGLLNYLQKIAALTPAEYDELSVPAREAFWLDVYDAFTIKIVLDHYPIHGNIPYFPENSLRQIPDVWETFQVVVAGKKMTLYQIEHEILRRQVHDVRTHFAVSCAAKGAGPTPLQAYTAENLEQELNDSAKNFLNDKRNLELDPAKKLAYVSRVFKWFPLDFVKEAGFKKIPFPPPSDDEVVLGYLAVHGTPDVQKALEDPLVRGSYKVVYRDFDWSLNDADVLKDAAKPQ